ncbi:MAG: hypothetical protein M1836_001862 [Candelina mexicana]|nr:MAG: hypothetical protein M1836_001862 [Candelina mexicana]
MNSRFKNLGFKRKSSTNVAPQNHYSPPGGPAPPRASSSSNTSLPMNPNYQMGRPPSYTQGSGQLGAPQPPPGRSTSPIPPAPQGMGHPPPSQLMQGPPPINTGGYPPHQGPPAMGGAPQAPGPPGYGGAYGQGGGAPPLAQYGNRGSAVEVEGAGRSKAQLIVGIDFGTTFSGVAFAFATNTEAKEDIITEWPGAGNQTKQKIPTVLYYDQYQKVVGWGPDIADALAPTGYPKPGVQKVEWFKLQLMLSGNTYIDPINLPPLPPGKSEIDVAADYLFKLRQAMRNQLQKTLGEVFNREERNIRYFLTVPAIWNDAGKAATRAAAIQAGFLRDENDNRLTLITEPEAAAMFCSKTGLLNLKIHDAVLIVDCGGGTVDLIAYEVEEEAPFTVAECTAGSGDSCGSTALNRNFSNILRAKIRKMKLPDGSKTAGKVYAKCIMDFENRIKADFRNNGQKWAVDVGIEAEFPEAGIEEGYMTFTNEEILQCFEPVVNRILELVRNQIIAIQAQNRQLQNVLVVGGFGASEYLFQQIKLHVPPQFQAKVVRPMDSVAAIVKGAVTAGITERVVTSRVARRHYLMATLQPFKEGHHPEQYRVPSLDGKDRCKYTRQIFVQKGQRVKIGEPVKVSFFRQVAPGATLMYEDILYACDDDVCPEYTKDPRIKEVVTLTSDLSRKNLEKDFERMDTPQGTFYRVYFDIYLTLDGSEFNAELVCQGEIMEPSFKHGLHPSQQHPVSLSIPATSDTASLTLHAPPNSDIWRKPPTSNPSNAFTGPIYHQTLLLKDFSSADVTVSAHWSEKYDQGGLIFVLPGRTSETSKWIKAGIECVEGKPTISVVACDRWADWSLIPLIAADTPLETVGASSSSASPRTRLSIPLRRETGNSLWVYVADKEPWRRVRKITWAFEDEDDGRECWVGAYAARPATGEGVKSLEVEFHGLMVHSQ